MHLKFKFRIALYNTLSVAITTAFVFLIIYFVVYKTSYAHLDDDILTEKEEVFGNLDWNKDSILIHKLPEWEENEHTQIEVNPTFLQIVDTLGFVIFHSANLLDDQILYNPILEKTTFYNSIISGQKIRLGQFPIQNDSEKIIGHLSIAISREESFNVLRSLFHVLVIAFPIVLLIQFAASSIAAAQAIQPVIELTKTASNISFSTIETRLSLPQRKDELYELTVTINDLLARIESSALQQKQFTSDASHEIRTPLTAIRGTLEVLIRKQRDPKTYQDRIKDIITQVDRLTDLLEQLLHLARIESSQFNAKKETVLLFPIISEYKTKWDEFADKRGIRLDFQISELDKILHSDQLFVELILDNLITNAIKYGKKDGFCSVKWHSTKRLLTIEDNGIGIQADELPFIFDRFYRADSSRSSTIKGKGLGLSIVKKLADLAKIRIMVTSVPQKGTQFTLEFPE
jgi:signal transduction histidine kinase